MIKNIFQTFFTKILTALLNLITIVWVSRYLGSEGKGITSLITTTVSFFLVATNVYAGTSLVYFTPRENNGSLIVTAYGWTFIVLMCGGVLLAIFGAHSNTFLVPVLVVSAFQSLFYVHLKWLMGKEKVVATNVANGIQSASMLLAFLAFCWFFPIRLEWYVYSLYISFGLAYLVSVFMTWRFWTTPDWANLGSFWKKISAYGWLNQADNVLFLLTIRFNFYLLEWYAGPSALGIYSNGVALAEAVWLLTHSVSIVLYARLSNQKDEVYAQKTTVFLAKVSACVSFIGIGCLSLVPDAWYLLVFGKSFEGIQTIILLFWPGVTLFSAGLVVSQYYSGTGKFKWNALFSLLGFGFVVVLGWWLIPQWGMQGAAFSASLAYGITGTTMLVVFTSQSKLIRAKDWFSMPTWPEMKRLIEK